MEEDIFNTELGRKILALTKASFKVSDLISDLALRERIKNQILNVYRIFFSAQGESASSGEKKYSDLLKELDILDGFFFLAGHLNLAKEEHVKTLRNGLLVFKSKIILTMYPGPKIAVNDFFLAAEQKLGKPPVVKSIKREMTSQAQKKDSSLSDRQEKILRYFKENKNILKLADLLTLFPDVNEKTVRNDLVYLIQIGKISRHGAGNGSHYQLLEK